LATALCFADALGIAHRDIRQEPRIYEATAGTLLEIVRAQDDGDLHVALFGHNPGFSDCARLLLDDCPFVELPTCAAVTIELPVASWTAVDRHEGRLRRYRHPKEH
jgi:phosphohistidine phosphatase